MAERRALASLEVLRGVVHEDPPACVTALAEVLRRYFRQAGLEFRAKGSHDFVTLADHESEDRVIAEIRGRFPSHRILAEELNRYLGRDGAVFSPAGTSRRGVRASAARARTTSSRQMNSMRCSA